KLAADGRDALRHARAVRNVRRCAGEWPRRTSGARRHGSEGGLLRVTRRSGARPAVEPPLGGDGRSPGRRVWSRAARVLRALARPSALTACGEVSEWLKEHAWKACVGETLPWVRIPPSPPRMISTRRGARVAERGGLENR